MLFRDFIFFFFFFFFSYLWLGASWGCAQSSQWGISWQKHREKERERERERGEMKSDTWASDFSQTAFIPSSSIWTSKLHQHMPNRLQLQNSNLKAERLRARLFMRPQCVFLLVCLRRRCAVMCFHNSPSLSLHVPTFRTQQPHQSSSLSPLISPSSSLLFLARNLPPV